VIIDGDQYSGKYEAGQRFHQWYGEYGTDPEPVALFRPHFRGWVAPR
jgi:hypothetical protein